MKSEPSVYSIDALERDRRTMWEGVRNYQARNLMRDEMAPGDLALFYHSSTDPTGVAGVARGVCEAYPDPTQFAAGHKYFDAKSGKDKPRWHLVDVEHVESFTAVVTLASLKAEPALEGMMVIKRGMRLSVQPVDKDHFKKVLQMAGAKTRVR